jgi:peptide chain release factor 2
LKEKNEELLALIGEADFWEREDAHKITREISLIQEETQFMEDGLKEFEDLEALGELLADASDKDLEEEFYSRGERLKESILQKQLVLLLKDEHDMGNAIVSIHPGAGGLDSQDWAEILYRMYVRWAEREGFTVKLIDYLPDPEAGLRSVTFQIIGKYAYGYLRAERGIHRLVRISPFDSAKRRHTSFASFDVIPELPETASVEIRPEDLRIETFRSSGAGGQHVNMTDSAVRITHIPTNFVVGCQTERSQHMNRQTAMKVLESRLYEKMLKEQQEQMEALQGEKKESSWGNQIRSYVLHPYTLVKDHRTGCEVGNVQSVLDGNVQPFIMEYLRWKKNS